MPVSDLDGFVVGAWKAGKLAGQRLRYTAATEQIFFHYLTGAVVYTPIVFHGTKQCSDGTAYDEYGTHRLRASTQSSIRIRTAQPRK